MSKEAKVSEERLRELRDWCFAAGGWHMAANDLRVLRDLKDVIDKALHLRTLSALSTDTTEQPEAWMREALDSIEFILGQRMRPEKLLAAIEELIASLPGRAE